MAEVEVGLGTVIEHVNFAVLVGRHGARIDVKIRVELLHQDLKAALFEQCADGCRCKTFAERGNDAAGDEDVFHSVVRISVWCCVRGVKVIGLQ